MAAGLTDTLEVLATGIWAWRGWLVILIFLAGSALEYVDRRSARRVLVAGWFLFAIFWASMVPYFVFEQKSILESLGTILAVPLSVVVGYHLARGRDSLFVISRSVAIAGLIFQPVVTLAFVRQGLVEVVTDQTAWLISLLGRQPEVVDGFYVDGLRIAEKAYPYDSTFVFRESGQPITYNIAVACTGIGSLAIFGGLIGGVSASWRRKLRALAISLPVIYGLNLVRNVFIAIGFGEQHFHVAPGLIMPLFGLEDPLMVSYYVVDRLLAQSASVLALVAITWLVVRELPEVLLIVEDGLFVLTGQDYDLQAALGFDDPDVTPSST
jgi:archaeosortase A (PGF-CTERM-specific)